ncbi:MAG: hypothetical protein H2057_00725 [Alphaproteobacteria bacterium]|nr:hypothetical protein [Alphaproteobacteria bacterium]
MTSYTKVSAVALLAALSLSACSHQQNSGWAKDCDKYYSYDSREHAKCLERATSGSPATQSAPGTVVTDPEDTKFPAEGTHGSEKGRQ